MERSVDPLDTQKDTANPAPPALEYAWGQYRMWAAQARRLKSQLRTWRITVLLLTAAGSVLGVLATQIETGADPASWLPKALGLAAAVAVALAGYFGKQILSPERERQWVHARATAEACKTEAFRFATGTEPYADAQADERLLDKIGEFERTAAGAWVAALDENARRHGLPPYPMDAPAYLEQRVADQVAFYDRASAAHARIMTRGIYAGWVLGAASALLGTVNGFFDVQGPAAWIAVIGALSAAIASFLLSGRYQYLTVTYRATGDKLRLEKARWGSLSRGQPDPAAFQSLVDRCEAIITAENSAWMVEWTQRDGGTRPKTPTSSAAKPAAPAEKSS